MANGMTIIKAEIRSVAPIMLHNGQLANPRNEHAQALKKVTSVRGKTEDQHEEISRLEFIGSLYWDPELGVYVTGEMLTAALTEGARKNKKGKNFESAVFVDGNFPLVFEGSKKTPDELYQRKELVDVRGVVVSQARVMRTRPKIKDWSVAFEISMVEEAGVNVDDIQTALQKAGVLCGIGDFRPRYGRFETKKFQVV